MIADTYIDTVDKYDYFMSLKILDYIVNTAFIIECIIKVVAQGFVLDSGSYLRDSWS